LVLYNDRQPRPGEQDGVDYHFRSRPAIEAFRGQDRYAVVEVRGDLQALDVDELAAILGRGDAFFEGNPFVACALLAHPRLGQIAKLSCFLSPLSREEILACRRRHDLALSELVADVMRRKLLRRTQRQRGTLGLKDLEEIERRARSAYRELQLARCFDQVIVNHDGEDSEQWDAFPEPIGDARRSVETFATLLRGDVASIAEKWDEELLPRVPDPQR
jgi:guanylate kinase